LEHPRTVEYRQGKSPVRKRHELELGPLTRGELRQPSMKQVPTGQPARIAERDQDHEQGVTLRLAGHRRFAHCRGLARCERGGPLSLAARKLSWAGAITLTALRKGAAPLHGPQWLARRRAWAHRHCRRPQRTHEASRQPSRQRHANRHARMGPPPPPPPTAYARRVSPTVT